MKHAERKRYVLVKGCAGLGNRLSNLASAIAYAAATKRIIVVDWRDGMYAPKGVDAFERLFLPPPGSAPLSAIDLGMSAHPAIWQGNLAEALADLHRRETGAEFQETRLETLPYTADLSRDHDADVVVVSDLVFNHPQLAAHADILGKRWPSLSKKDAVMSAIARECIVPAKHVRKAAESFLRAHGLGKGSVGVHIRHTDNMDREHYRTSVDVFLDAAESLLKDRPESPAFVATDSAEALRRASERFPRIEYLEKRFSPDGGSLHHAEGDKLANAERALVELVVLSRCDRLVYSTKSTYSTWAMLLREGGASAVDADPKPARVPLYHVARLPGELWGMTCLFNPAGYKNKNENFRTFRERSKAQGLKLLAVELAFDTDPFVLTDGDAEVLVQVRGSRADNLMWQKERLLSIGVGKLPASCDKVALLDADVIFKDDEWVKRTARLLEKYAVVQPYDISVRLPRGTIDLSDQELGSLDEGWGDMQKKPGFANEYVERGTIFGHAGYAWAIRRSLIESAGLFDRMILGGGDTMLAYAAFGVRPDTLFSQQPYVHPMLVNRYAIWWSRFDEACLGSATFLPGTVLHLWHGETANRVYNWRYKVLKVFGFDPDEHVKVGANGLLEWAPSSDPRLRQAVADYFRMRQEEGGTSLGSIIASVVDEKDKALKQARAKAANLQELIDRHRNRDQGRLFG